ncbi:Uncharacterized protein Rs2_24052 [Raphanus sativus]|nr:Uncharacterized protein Rs2_24052 [Raphanus sativus]
MRRRSCCKKQLRTQKILLEQNCKAWNLDCKKRLGLTWKRRAPRGAKRVHLRRDKKIVQKFQISAVQSVRNPRKSVCKKVRSCELNKPCMCSRNRYCLLCVGKQRIPEEALHWEGVTFKVEAIAGR